MTVDLTRRGGDAHTLARGARERGADLVVVMGGDGTVNEAAAALVDTPVALCPFPAGGTNVFARALGWPRDSHGASRALATRAARAAAADSGGADVEHRTPRASIA